MSSKTSSKKQRSGSTDPLQTLKDQRFVIQGKMSMLAMKAYQPSVIDPDGQVLYKKWVSEKAEKAFKRMEALLFVINQKIKEHDELQGTPENRIDR